VNPCLEPVGEEIAWIRRKLQSVAGMRAGNCFLRRIEVTELVGEVQRVMREWRCYVDYQTTSKESGQLTMAG
jgi:hypothetical protein